MRASCAAFSTVAYLEPGAAGLLFKLVGERLSAGESRIGLMPPGDFIFVGLPAEVHDASITIVREVNETGA